MLKNVANDYELNVPNLDDAYLYFGGSENNHPISIKINPVPIQGEGLKSVTISSKGIDIKSAEKHNGRGVNITLSFASEQGEFWDMEFRFHKGVTLVSSKFIKEQEGDELDFETIWRD